MAKEEIKYKFSTFFCAGEQMDKSEKYANGLRDEKCGKINLGRGSEPLAMG